MEAEKNKQLEIVKIKIQLQEYAGLISKAANSLKKATEDKKIRLLSDKINAYKAAYDVLHDELKELDKEVSSSKIDKPTSPYGGAIFPSTTQIKWGTGNTTPTFYTGGGGNSTGHSNYVVNDSINNHNYLTYTFTSSTDSSVKVEAEVAVVKDWYNDEINEISAEDKEDYYLKKIQEYPG